MPQPRSDESPEFPPPRQGAGGPSPRWGEFPVVAGLLKAGLLSGEHVGALAPIREHADDVRVVALWAVGKPPEDLRAEVERIRLSHLAGSDAYARQRAMRRLVLTTGPEGMVAVHGLLPPKEGALLESLLRTVTDANWLHDHPDRAEALGGHAGDTRDQRRLDALLQLLGLMPSPLGHSRDAAADSAGEATHPSAADAGSSPGVASDTDPPGKPRPMQVNTGKPAVVIVFDVDRYEAEILGHGPTPVTPELFDPVKVDLYYFFKNGKGEILKFARARRDPTAAQRLAIEVRDRDCLYPGCRTPASRCQVHHLNEWLRDYGFTDVEVLGLFCDSHHRHLHLNDLKACREPDGGVTISIRASGEIIARASPTAAWGCRVG